MIADKKEQLGEIVRVALVNSESVVSVWDTESGLCLVVNTFGSVRLTVVASACWSLGYLVDEVVIRCMSEDDEAGCTSVLFRLSAI